MRHALRGDCRGAGTLLIVPGIRVDFPRGPRIPGSGLRGFLAPRCIGSFPRMSTSSVSLRFRNALSFFCDRGCASRSACASERCLRGRGGGVGEPALMPGILPLAPDDQPLTPMWTCGVDHDDGPFATTAIFCPCRTLAPTFGRTRSMCVRKYVLPSSPRIYTE